MQQNRYELWVISYCKNISKEVCTTCQFIFLSHPLLHPRDSVNFKFCFLQQQYFMQLVQQLHLMSSLQAWDASAIVVQIDSIPSSRSFYPHSSMLISWDQFFVCITQLHFFVRIIFFVRNCCKTWIKSYGGNIQ